MFPYIIHGQRTNHLAQDAKGDSRRGRDWARAEIRNYAQVTGLILKVWLGGDGICQHLVWDDTQHGFRGQRFSGAVTQPPLIRGTAEVQARQTCLSRVQAHSCKTCTHLLFVLPDYSPQKHVIPFSTKIHHLHLFPVRHLYNTLTYFGCLIQLKL